ncbi:MAG: ATP-binding protein [Nitrospirae bacterium]|nr:ATP-binding protein [Nitrospirota bacterium]MCL5423426.1 ATP-binding protein [Nitrospirota bacterium]
MNESIVVITSFLLLAVFIALFLFRVAGLLGKERESSKKKEETQVGFIVGTFHELVAKLKEKEKELENLRKRAEERADVVESYSEYILQSVPSGVISLDRNLIITKVNAAAERILGLKAEDAIGKCYDEIFREPLKSILEGKTSIQRREIQYTVHSGKEVHVGLTVTPLLNEAKESIGQLMVFTDLTELKALEAQAVLRDRLSSLGEMAAGMAHELRNPMAVIAGYTKMLSKKADPSLLHVVDSVATEVAVMDRIIADFLSFARPTELNVSSVDLDQLIRRCVANIAEDRKDIRVHFNTQGIPPVPGDEILLRQAFTNLIQNAVDAMPQGGDLGFGFTQQGNVLGITVSDSGHGIPEKIHDKIFLPFYTTKDRGTGLGLAIVHKIVVSHRGSITVESSEQGTTFRVRLPLKTH